MSYILVIFYLLSFIGLAWFRFRPAVIFFIILLPSYLVRFHIGPLPSTVLELSFAALFLVWLIKYSRNDWKKILIVSKKHIWFFVAFDLFFLSSVISIFVSDMPIPSLGQWRAYFFEPMILFLILIGRKSSDVIPMPKEESLYDGAMNGQRSLAEFTPSNDGARDDKMQQIGFNDLIWALALSTISISVYSIIQKFTGWGIATTEWTGEATRRVTAFFSSPNAVGLYLAPVAMLIIPLLLRGGQGGVAKVWAIRLTPATPPSPPLGKRRMTYALLMTVFVFSLLAIIFTKSQGALVGLAAGTLTFLFFVGHKKIAIAAMILGIIFSLAVPSARQALLFQDQANQNRLRLWNYTRTFLAQSPKNFILGAGVRQFFRKVQKPHYNDKIMERLIYPHNIFLNFWTEIGLIGMLAAAAILGHTFYLSDKIRKNNKLIGAGLIGALIVLTTHGLVDVPYFKNDLAFLFWIMIAVPFYYIYEISSHENIY